MPTIGELIRSNQPPAVTGNAAMVANRDQRREFINTSGSAFGQAFADRLAGNIANIPDVIGTLGAGAVNQVADITKRALTGDETLIGRRMQRGVQEMPAGFMGPPESSSDVRDAPIPQRAPLIAVPTLGQEFVGGPSSSDILGVVQRIGEGAAALRTGDFSQFRPDASAQQKARTEAMAQQSPVSTILGTISGDVFTLMTGRAPIASARGNAQLTATQAAKLAEKSGGPVALAPSVKAALQSVTTGSKTTATLLNRAGRVGEAGLEGFALAALNGNADPLETAAFAAGTQAAGSVFLGGMTGLLSGGPVKAGTKLAISAVAIGSMMQIFKAATPAGDGSVMELPESLKAGFDKVALGLAAGIVSGAAGMGRVTNRFPVTALPQVADMITSMPRAATISVITSMLEDPAAEAVVNKLSTDPNYFDPAALRRIERAFLDERVNLSSTIEDLMNNREFRQKFEALQ